MPHRALRPWSPRLVGAFIIEAFAAPNDQRGLLAAEAISWPAIHLGTDPCARDAVLAWAAIRAGKRGCSVTEWCQEHDIPRQTFESRLRRGCAGIAARLNQDG